MKTKKSPKNKNSKSVSKVTKEQFSDPKVTVPILNAAIELYKNLNSDILCVIDDMRSKINRIHKFPESDYGKKGKADKDPESAAESLNLENARTKCIYEMLVEINNHLYTII